MDLGEMPGRCPMGLAPLGTHPPTVVSHFGATRGLAERVSRASTSGVRFSALRQNLGEQGGRGPGRRGESRITRSVLTCGSFPVELGAPSDVFPLP